MERIVVRRPAEQPLEYTLYRDKTRIGTDPWNEISLPVEEGVSGCHAEVLKAPSGAFIIDLDSDGGTFVNGERVKEKELRDGDRVTIGGCTLICLAANSAFADAALAPVPAQPESPALTPEPEPEPAPEPQPKAQVTPEILNLPAAESAVTPEEEPPPAEVADAAECVPVPQPEEISAPEITEAATAAEVPFEAADPGEATLVLPRRPEEDFVPEAAQSEQPAVELSAESETPVAATADENEATLALPRRQDEPTAPEPAAAVEPRPERDENEATFILQRKQEPLAPEPARAEESAAAPEPAKVEASGDRFAITSIMKVPKKRQDAGPAPQELEEGVIEIEVKETSPWSKVRLGRRAALAAATVALLAAAAALRSPALQPASELRFTVEPADAQVYVNDKPMPRAGSGVLRHLRPGKFAVRVAHNSYKATLTAEVQTGLFKRRAEIEATQAGITAR